MLAVDAGSHLAAITRILEKDFPLVSETPVQQTVLRPRNGNGNAAHDESPSPRTAPSDEDSGADTTESEEEPPPTITTLEKGAFAGLPFPHASARANALHVVREHVSTYLITHPHLDHVSGFVINTAAFHNTSRPKRLAALPFTVNAIKTHIFNNILWPNLTDEDGGVGLVTFQRLAEGGNIALGEGSGRGYIEVCDGLGVRGFKVSHGHCMTGPSHIHRTSNANVPETPGIQRAATHPYHDGPLPAEGREGRSLSFSLPAQSAPGTPLFTGTLTEPNARNASIAGTNNIQFEQCVIDSTVYFIRAEATSSTPCKEVLVFGDVEPDSISLSPRTHMIWAEAAPKIATGTLTGIFIECSYTNAQGDPFLYGHLSPRHLLAELQSLADMVKDARREHEKEKEEARSARKRKRASYGLLSGVDGDGARKSSRTRSLHVSKTADAADDEIMTDYARSPTPAPKSTDIATHGAHHAHGPAAASSSATHAPALNVSSVSAEHTRALINAASTDAPLKGLRVIVIHVKDTLADGPMVGDHILRELVDGEKALAEQGKALGCAFEISKSGSSYYF